MLKGVSKSIISSNFQPERAGPAPTSMHPVLSRRDQGESSRKSVVVALDGEKSSGGTTAGVAPLVKALRDLVVPADELLVLAILNVTPEALPAPPTQDSSPYFQFLLQQVSQRKEHYRNIFRPFYDQCKSSEVKFQLKVSAGCQSRDIIMEQANNTKATWIVIDRCFARDMSPRSSDADCSISLVGQDEEAMILKYLAQVDGSGTSSVHADKEVSDLEPPDRAEELPSPPVRESMNPTMYDCEQSSQRLCDLMEKRPVQLSEEKVAAITGGFLNKISTNRRENSETYSGFEPDDQSRVMVKRYKGDSGGVLEAEKKAASCMCHVNILGLRGYHSNENATVLVFPFPTGRTLDDYLYGSRGKEVGLTFLDKMKIALGIAKGIRYMHEECPRGPVAHGDLQPHNIILGHDFNPQISGFGGATWLHLEQPLRFTTKRYPNKESSDNPCMVLVKLDVLSFGILLLRMFCRKQYYLPRDDKRLIKWAQPLLEERAFHELLDEDSLDLDMYGIYRVMTAATRCTKNKISSRPSMSEVISILRGESSCALQCSPSTESSVHYLKT